MELASEPYARRRFTADDVMRMLAAGVLHEGERVELIEGELIVVNPQGPHHASLTVHLHRMLERAYGADHHVRDHSPVAGTTDSTPEPDLAVVRGEPLAFSERLPGPAEVRLVVEVSHSTLAIDRRKARTYAKSGYETYWLIDVEARQVEVRTGPMPDGAYAKTEILTQDASVTAPGTASSLRVSALLP